MYNQRLHNYDRQHIYRILQQQNAVSQCFNLFIKKTSPYLRQWSDKGGNNVWVKNASIEKKIDTALIELYHSLLANIKEFQIDAWKRSNLKNDELIRKFIGDLSISSIRKEGYFSRNIEASKALLQMNKKNGINLSNQVWNITEQTKTNLEFYLNCGISAGRNAESIGRDIRQILKNPDKRFRRVRDKNGKLKLSRPMQDYHPGAGVYRSSRMNALRLSATQTNISYRAADYNRWQTLDFIVGIDIQRSPSNHGPCKICDAMVGQYPKEFQFLGFHPFCICIATPILLNSKDFADFLLDDKIPQEQLITNIPTHAYNFMHDNRYMHNSYTFRDNKAWFKRDVIVINTDSNNDKERKLYDAIKETENNIRMNKDFETAVVYNKKGEVVLYKKGGDYNVGFTIQECANMKDGILTHNHPRGWYYPDGSIERIGNSFSINDIKLAVNTNLAEIRAVTPNFTFIMKRPDSGWGDYNKTIKIIGKENRELFKEFEERIYKNTLTTRQASTTHFHILWKRVSKKLGWIYSKAKTR